MNKSRKVLMILIIAFAAAFTITATASAGHNSGFERWPVITIEGEDYYWAGAPDGPNGETDVPGHDWRQVGPNRWAARHFNTGPIGASSWWSSDAPDGALLYKALVIIDKCTPEKAAHYAAEGFVHYHELLSVTDGTPHPTQVGWFKHVARFSFTLDGGPAPQFAHTVSRGVDLEFIPNWMMPYQP